MGTQYTGVDCEIVHSLFTLLNQRIPVYFPCESRHVSVDFFKSLIYWYGAYRHAAVADDPFAGLMYVVASGKVHKRVSSPIAAPYGFCHFFLDSGRKRGVADVRVEFDGKP